MQGVSARTRQRQVTISLPTVLKWVQRLSVFSPRVQPLYCPRGGCSGPLPAVQGSAAYLGRRGERNLVNMTSQCRS